MTEFNYNWYRDFAKPNYTSLVSRSMQRRTNERNWIMTQKQPETFKSEAEMAESMKMIASIAEGIDLSSDFWSEIDPDDSTPPPDDDDDQPIDYEPIEK